MSLLARIFGAPESVPAGQYAEEVFTSLGILDEVKSKANRGCVGSGFVSVLFKGTLQAELFAVISEK